MPRRMIPYGSFLVPSFAYTSHTMCEQYNDASAYGCLLRSGTDATANRRLAAPYPLPPPHTEVEPMRRSFLLATLAATLSIAGAPPRATGQALPSADEIIARYLQ